MRIYTDKEKRRALELAMELASAVSNGENKKVVAIVEIADKEKVGGIMRGIFAEIVRSFRASLNEEKKTNRYERSKLRCQANAACPKWQIQSRYMCEFSDGWGDWENWAEPFKASAREAQAILVSQRQRHAPSKNHPDEKWEWRAILV